MFGRRGWAGGEALFRVSPGAAHVVVSIAAMNMNSGAFKVPPARNTAAVTCFSKERPNTTTFMFAQPVAYRLA